MKHKVKQKTGQGQLTSLGVAVICLLFSSLVKAQDTSWYSESETVFTLTTADQILGLRDLVKGGTSFKGKYIKLGNDIDISPSITNWVKEFYGIGTTANPFDGTFDGCNHVINYNFNGNGWAWASSNHKLGLFGHTGGSSIITRLVVTGEIKNVKYDTSSNENYIGGIVAYSYGTISDCTSRISITYNGLSCAQYIGGICGYNGGNIYNCLNSGSINVTYTSSGTDYVGGIVGQSSSQGSITYCVNNGSISTNTTQTHGNVFTGGICGDIFGTQNSNIIRCENTNSISATSTGKLGTSFVGGIVGFVEGKSTISYCRNTGNCSAVAHNSTGAAAAGGICGLCSDISIDNCYVACSSISSIGSANYPGPGPIIGRILDNKTLNIAYCFANNDITYNKNNSTTQAVNKSFSLNQMYTINFCNELNNHNLGWVGGEGVLPIVFGSLSETDSYTTYDEPTTILFDTDTMDIPIGMRIQKTANVLPLGAYPKLTWESSNPGVVTIDEDGVLWSVGVGNAVITATSVRNNAISATCNVHVGTNDVSSIMLPKSIKLKVNESKTIGRTIVPSYANYNLTWESANEQVATVDQNGNVTGINIGETEIMVTDNLTNVQATCSVFVAMEVGDTFTADIPNGSGTVSTTFMLTDSENRYVSVGDGSNAAIATAITGSIVIPETIVGPGNFTYTVISIGSKAFASSKISAVTIPSRITAIGDNAFNGCSSLTSVTVESTEPIAINSTCFSVKAGATLNVPKGCYEAYKATDVWKDFGSIVEPLHTNGDTFAASITAGSSTTKATFVVVDAANKYVSVGNGEESAIADYTSGNIVIPSTVKGYDGQTYQVKQISDAAFFDCYEVTSFQLPDGIISIGRVAFYDCAGLTSFTIPATVTSIDEEAFNNCYNLTSINIPSSVTSLGAAAFIGCSKLTSVTVNWSEPIAIDDECFTNAANATLNIPKGSYMNYATAENWKNFKTIKEPAHSLGDTFMASITAGGTKVDATFKVTNTTNKYVSIGDGEDSAIDIFTSGNIVIPSTVKGYDGQTYTVKKVSDAAFFGCENVSSVSLPSSITEIGNSAFLRCYNLANITIPTSLTKIGDEAFFYCEKLSSISIPKNVTSIGTKAFKNCNMLTSVTAGWNTPIAIDSECFSNAANATLNVPYGAKERYEAATGWKQFKNIVEMAPKDGDMFTALTAEGIKMTFTIISASAKTCKVGDGSNPSVPTGTNGLVTIPSSANGFAVTQIAYKAFYNCSQITGTVIPTSVTSIGSYAFSGCNNLTSVTVGWDEPISIGTTCFSNAANATLYVPIGTNYDYSIATGWKNFGQIANWTNSSLAADDVIVCRGGQLTLPITLSNEEAIRSLQFELSLPEGASVVTDGKGNPIASLTQRANTTHIITGTPLSNGNFQFQIMPKAISDDVIQGNEGRIATITLKVLMNTAPNDYEIRITDSELDIDGEIMPLLLPETESKLTVSSVLLGDTNNDKRVSVTDISNIIDYILHKDIPGFVWHAANASGDEKISVTDISTIIDIILHKTVFGEKQATRKEEIDQQ